jgi:hypothetical protein
MNIYVMWPWKMPKWPWFWAEVAVKTGRDLATLDRSINAKYVTPNLLARYAFPPI